MQLIDGRQAVQLFHDSHLKPGVIVFIDARDEEHYQAGHIPGAYEFDPYHPEKYFPAVLPVCQAAEQIVVYCNGGDCDDSETAALLLRDMGIPNQKLFVYGGGITEWTNNHLPVETGARNSGNLQQRESMNNQSTIPEARRRGHIRRAGQMAAGRGFSLPGFEQGAASRRFFETDAAV